MALKRRHKIVLITLPIYWIAIFLATHMPKVPRWLLSNRMSDKTMHFMCYFALVFLLWTAISPYHKVDWRKIKVWIVLAIIVWYGAIDEYLQSFVGRTCDPHDFMADLAGTLTGLIIMSIFSFWQSCLAYTCISVFIITNLSHVSTLGQNTLVNTAFHFFAYALASILWIHCSDKLLKDKKSKLLWILKALSLPCLLLAVVKGVAPLTGKTVYAIDIYTALSAIAITTFVSFSTGLFSKHYLKKDEPQA